VKERESGDARAESRSNSCCVRTAEQMFHDAIRPETRDLPSRTRSSSPSSTLRLAHVQRPLDHLLISLFPPPSICCSSREPLSSCSNAESDPVPIRSKLKSIPNRSDHSQPEKCARKRWTSKADDAPTQKRHEKVMFSLRTLCLHKTSRTTRAQHLDQISAD
jgi:hypothetical protein